MATLLNGDLRLLRMTFRKCLIRVLNADVAYRPDVVDTGNTVLYVGNHPSSCTKAARRDTVENVGYDTSRPDTTRSGAGARVRK